MALDSVSQNFIGKGIVFPITLDNGRPPINTGVELIKSSLLILFSWDKGNRIFLEEYGTRLNLLLEEPNDDILRSLVYSFIREAITKFEKRVIILDITLNKEGLAKLNILVNFKIRNTQVEGSLVFPFYTKTI